MVMFTHESNGSNMINSIRMKYSIKRDEELVYQMRAAD